MFRMQLVPDGALVFGHKNGVSDSDDSSEMDEDECEKRRVECLESLDDLEKQFNHLREKIFEEKMAHCIVSTMKRSYPGLDPLCSAARTYLNCIGNDNNFEVIFHQIDKESMDELIYDHNMKRNKLSTEENETSNVDEVETKAEAETKAQVETNAEIEKHLDKAALKYNSMKEKMNCIDITKVLINKGMTNKDIKYAVYFNDEEIDSIRDALKGKKGKKVKKNQKKMLIVLSEKITSDKATRKEKSTKKNSENQKKIVKVAEMLKRKERHKTPFADIENQQKSHR